VHGLRILHLLLGEVALLVLGEHAREDEHRVQRGAQLVAHVRQKLRAVLRRQLQLLGFLFDGVPRQFDLALFLVDLFLLLLQEGRLLFEFFVCIGQLLLLRLQAAGELLRLLQQRLGALRRLDRVDDDADRVGQLIEEGELNIIEGFEGGQFQHGAHLAFEENRHDDDVHGRRLAETTGDLHVVVRGLRKGDALFFEHALPDQTLARLEAVGQALAFFVGVSADETHVLWILVGIGGNGLVAGVLGQVEHSVTGFRQRSQFRENHRSEGA